MKNEIYPNRFIVEEKKETAEMFESASRTTQCPWSEKLQVVQVERKDKQQNGQQNYTCWRIITQLTYIDQLTESIMLKALKVQIRNSSPYIQTYFSIYSNGQTPNHRLEAELYRYTLADILQVCQNNNMKLPEKAGQYIIFCILQIYKYLLYLITEKKSQQIQGVVYDPSTKNLGFNSEYRLILLNPCHSKREGIFWRSLLVSTDTISAQFRSIMKKTLQNCSQYLQNIWKGNSLLAFLAQTVDVQKIKIENERMMIEVFQTNVCGGQSEIPKQFFQFLKQKIEPRLKKTQLLNVFQKIQVSRRQQIKYLIHNRLENV